MSLRRVLVAPHVAGVTQSSESAGVFVESLHIVQDPPCVDGKYLCERHLDHIDLALLCDIKQTASVTAVRLNDDKVLDWLTAKVLAVFAVLRDTPSLALLCKPADDTAAVGAQTRVAGAR